MHTRARVSVVGSLFSYTSQDKCLQQLMSTAKQCDGAGYGVEFMFRKLRSHEVKLPYNGKRKIPIDHNGVY